MSTNDKSNFAPLTITLTSYNYGKYIEDAIKSVVNQTSSEWKLIIFDNCSTDNTLKIIAPYLKDPRISLVVMKENIGQRNNLLQALQVNDSEFISTLQADDFLDTTYVEVALNAFRSNPDIPFVFFNWQYFIDRKKTRLNHKLLPFSPDRHGVVRTGPYLSVANFVPLHMIVFKASCLQNCLSYFSNSPLNQLGEQFLLKILEDKYGCGYYTGTLGGVWRRHEKQLTNEHIASSIADIEEPIERSWYFSHAPNPDPINVFMALVTFVRLSSHVTYTASIDWLLGKGSFCIENLNIPLQIWSRRFYSAALVVAVKYSTYSSISLLNTKMLKIWLTRIGYTPNRKGFTELLNESIMKEGYQFLNSNEIIDICDRFFPNSVYLSVYWQINFVFRKYRRLIREILRYYRYSNF